jgi:SPX domain protein involved in polyphosphate accumulation
MIHLQYHLFNRLEKFVNLNFMGFHKILKKHDKKLPNPCKSFYIVRLQGQSWLRADYSDIMVSMSRVYSKLRGDKVKVADETAKQVSSNSLCLVGSFR